MFDNNRYITKGVKEGIPIQVQMKIWDLIDTLKNNKSSIDYLQVFDLKVITSIKDYNQIIIHSQEVPPYKNEYLYSTNNAVTAKVFVIDDREHSVMMLSEEY